VPICGGDRAIGVLSVQSTREEGRFGEADDAPPRHAGANVGVAIENARLFAEIARQKQYFESLVEISPVAVVVMDADERVTGWNPAAAELFGTRRRRRSASRSTTSSSTTTRGRGREITRRRSPRPRPPHHPPQPERRQRGSMSSPDARPLHGRRRAQSVSSGSITTSRAPAGREEAEAGTQAEERVPGDDEPRDPTPMNAVIGYDRLLLGTELTPEQREFAEVVRSSGDALCT
jgi:PAS domain-containing protein